MKRALLGLSAGAILALGPASTAVAQPVTYTYAVGSGTSALGNQFRFAAYATPTGVQGYMSLSNTLGSATAKVTCITVVGKSATIAGQVISGQGGLGHATALQFFVRDNGGQGVPDQFNETIAFGEPTLPCVPGTGLAPIRQGRIIVGSTTTDGGAPPPNPGDD